MKNTSVMFFIFLLCFSELSFGAPKLLSLKPDKLYTKTINLTIEYSSNDNMKPFIAMKGKCLNNIRIQHNYDYWIKTLRLPPNVTSVKEVVLISPDNLTVEMVAEINDHGLKSLVFFDDSINYFMENIKDKDYIILGIVKSYAIIDSIVIPLNPDGTKSFLNDCY